MTTTTIPTEMLFETNRFLASVATDRRKDLWSYLSKREQAPQSVVDAWEEANAMLAKSATMCAMNAPLGAKIETPDGGLIVASIGTVADAFSEAGRLSLRDGEKIQVVLTDDGGIAKRAFWHSLEEDGEPDQGAVRYEVYDATGRVAHGFIDSRSRRIVQTG